jgi:ferredoxin--NADP+ reductase
MGVPGEQPPAGPRVAIVGSGPAGFYLTDYLLRNADPRLSVDVFERLPVPFGLVRFGVAPDHQSIKRTSLVFHRTAQQPGFRFIGNVEVGSAVSVAELLAHYHAVVLAYGAAHDKRLGIPGEDLRGSFAATAFVGWYNGHPDFAERQFDLDAERAVVVGMGNVAMDVARLLVRDPEDLAPTDIASYALTALRESRVREVVLLGRRGPVQAAFDLGELIDIAELPDVGLSVEGAFPRVATEELDSTTRRLVDYVAALPRERLPGKKRQVILRFLASPSELVADGDRVRALKIENNELRERNGAASAYGTGTFEQIPTGIVVRSIGYQGSGLPGVPFDPARGIVPNAAGQVVDSAATVVPGLYAVGWIKRGPTGLIGSNKSDAKETSQTMLNDLSSWAERHVSDSAELIERLGNVHRLVGFSDFERIDAAELDRGKASGKVREKFVSLPALLKAIEPEPEPR